MFLGQNGLPRLKLIRSGREIVFPPIVHKLLLFGEEEGGGGLGGQEEAPQHRQHPSTLEDKMVKMEDLNFSNGIQHMQPINLIQDQCVCLPLMMNGTQHPTTTMLTKVLQRLCMFFVNVNHA